MRDAPSRRSGDRAPEHLPPPPGPPPAPGPPIPPRPTTPDAPGATRADRHGRSPRPTVLNDPSHHTRETHSDASATTLWTRRTRPSRPSPRPSRPTPSKPPLNNLHSSAGLPRTPGTAGQESHGATGGTMPKDSPAMGRVGPGGARSGAPPRGLTRNGGWGSWDGLEMGTCPDLLQRRSGPGSAARKSAEYQRFFSHASARPGSLQQIWTTGAARALAGGGGRLGGGRDERPGDPSGRGADPPDPSGRLRRPDVHFALESAAPTVVLECKMHVSARRTKKVADSPTETLLVRKAQ